jgi:Histidine kinase-, DNA gyrase B-, and HSP90-like ATPase
VPIAKIESEDDRGSRQQEALPAGRYVLVTITDDGLGIPPKHLPHIFEPFYRTKPAGKGTGSGLATVYGVVEDEQAFRRATTESLTQQGYKVLEAKDGIDALLVSKNISHPSTYGSPM